MKDFIEEKIKEKTNKQYDEELKKAYDIVNENRILRKLIINIFRNNMLDLSLNKEFKIDNVNELINKIKDEIKKEISDDFFNKISEIQNFMRE